MKLIKDGEIEVFSDDLKCFWLSWETINNQQIQLNLPENSCCNMRGAIKVASTLLPTVGVIYVESGGKPDILYTKLLTGKWECRDFRSISACASPDVPLPN